MYEKNNIITISIAVEMILASFFTVIYTPMVVEKIIERARKRSPTQVMALQCHDPSKELHIMYCLHGTEDVRSSINFMEISRGPASPGMTVYVTDMVEMTEKVAATVVHGMDGGAVTEEGGAGMREEITKAVMGYVEEDGDGLGLKRMLALATMGNMHQDICIMAEELMVSLIILPFHTIQKPGEEPFENSGFRLVNRKVLRHAPCSVGILVDRGFGSIKIGDSGGVVMVAVIFIGGKDDREVLCYAGRVARHSGVKVTVIRFLVDENAEGVSGRGKRKRNVGGEEEVEMKLDDECFTEFYEKHVSGGYVAYMEKHVANSGQTFSCLRGMEGQYSLFVVGRGGRVNSVLTAGMNDWEQCPELGPIGDILSTSEFSTTASVLIIQQHSIRGDLDGLHAQFSIM